MTLIDSLDSILMLYSYSGFPEHGWSIFAHDGELTDSKQPLDVERDPETLPITLTESPPPTGTSGPADSTTGDITVTPKSPRNDDQRSPSFDPVAVPETGDEGLSRDRRVEQNVLSGLSIVLTLMSILVAFACVRHKPCNPFEEKQVAEVHLSRISLITIMALIGEHCRACREAAEADEGRGGGLTGRWWRGWAKASHQPLERLIVRYLFTQASDNSGFIGAAIVGAFIFVVISWHGGRWCVKKYKARHGH